LWNHHLAWGPVLSVHFFDRQLTTTQTFAGAKTFSSAPTFSTMTAGRIGYFGTGGLVSNSANLTYNDTYKVIGLSGVTTSNWDYTGASPAGGGVIESTGASLFFFGNYGQFNNNAFYDGAWKRKTAAVASNLNIGDGILTFRNAATGAANSTITWSNRFHIGTNGRVGIGTVTPSDAMLRIEGADASTYGFNVQGTTSANNLLQATTNTGEAGIILRNDEAIGTAGASFSMYGSNFATPSVRSQGAFTSRQGLLFISNILSLSGGTSPLDFYTGGSQESTRVMRLAENSVAINSLGTTLKADASAVLHITSKTKGFLQPTQTSTERNAIATPQNGLQIYNTTDKTNDVYDNSGWRNQPNGLKGSATLDFGNTAAQTSADLTITVTGAADGDIVIVGPINASTNANSAFTAWVSAANTVTVRFNNYSAAAIDPASGAFKVYVIKN